MASNFPLKKFNTQYQNNGRKKSAVGSKDKILYSGVYDKKGHLDIIESGRENLYEKIQADRDSVDIKSIMRRYAGGETDVLGKVQGFYGDVSGLPNDYAAILNGVARGRDLFDQMPVDMRARFDHNFDKFMVSLCDGTVRDILSPTRSVGSPAIPGGGEVPSEGGKE